MLCTRFWRPWVACLNARRGFDSGAQHSSYRPTLSEISLADFWCGPIPMEEYLSVRECRAIQFQYVHSRECIRALIHLDHMGACLGWRSIQPLALT